MKSENYFLQRGMPILKSRFFLVGIILESVLVVSSIFLFNYVKLDPWTFGSIFIFGFFISFLFLFFYISKRNIQLFEQKQLFDTLMEHTTDTIVVKDIYGRYIKASKSARDFHSAPRIASLINMTDNEMQPYSRQGDDFFKTIKDMDKLAWQTRKPQKFILHLRDKDGMVHTIDVTKIPVYNKKGGKLLSIGVGHDITEMIEDEEKFKSMFYENSRIMFLLDSNSITVADANNAAIKFYGFSRKELIDKTINETFSPFIAKAEVLSNINRAVKNDEKIFSGYKHRLKNGDIRNVEVEISLIHAKGKPLALVTVFDVTDKLAAAAKIKSIQSLYYSILKEVSLIINPKSERELFHRTLSALQKGETMTACWIGCVDDDNLIRYITAKGKGTQELMKIKLTVDCHKKYMTIAERAICLNRIVYNNDHLSDPLLEPWHYFLEKNHWFSACACPIRRDNKLWGVLVCASDKKGMFTRDILEFMSKIGGLLSHSLNEFDLKKKLKEEKKNVEYLAHHDILTGLPNRLSLAQMIESAVKRANRNKTFTAIGMIDFDDFKYINDTFGHDEGDNLLKQFALRIKYVLRQTDHIIRLGGDEFILVLEDLKIFDDIYLFIARLEGALEKPFIIKNSEIFLKVSLGLTLYPLDKGSTDVLLVHADDAMYSVKAKKEEREKFWQLYKH